MMASSRSLHEGTTCHVSPPGRAGILNILISCVFDKEAAWACEDAGWHAFGNRQLDLLATVTVTAVTAQCVTALGRGNPA